MIRVVFMGTPDFAVPSLKALAEDGRYEIVGVFTQPDRPAGRGNRLTACPVKEFALEAGLPVYQFERIRRPEGVEKMRELAPDVCVTAAFGQILTQELLDIPVHGTVNVHASLLPKYRGSAPINWCILMGETEAGVTIMRTDAGIDTGDMLACRTTPIGELETAGELTGRLSVLGAELLRDTLPGYLSGEIVPVKQDEALSSYEPMLKKEMGELNWSLSAAELDRRVRGLQPWPGTWTYRDGKKLLIKKAAVPAAAGCPVSGAAPKAAAEGPAPGTVLRADKAGLLIYAGDGALRVLSLQPEGKKEMDWKSFLNGSHVKEGEVWG